jgi:hypothetical protein
MGRRNGRSEIREVSVVPLEPSGPRRIGESSEKSSSEVAPITAIDDILARGTRGEQLQRRIENEKPKKAQE